MNLLLLVNVLLHVNKNCLVVIYVILLIFYFYFSRSAPVKDLTHEVSCRGRMRRLITRNSKAS